MSDESAAREAEGCCISGTPPVQQDWTRHYDAVNAVKSAPANVQAEMKARMVSIPGGFFEMGARKSTFAADLDSPRRKVKVLPFLISPVAVTNADFARFTDATAYKTVAETEGWSFVFHLFLGDTADSFPSPPGLHWWRAVKGACWSSPEGPGSHWSGRETHPAVHISWFDAVAYCAWSGLRLPTEKEWERAARGGSARQKFPWGNAIQPSGEHRMNTWQGNFPHENTAEDGFIGTAPVDAYQPNGYGLYNMTGNVWEWAEDYFGPLPNTSTSKTNSASPDPNTDRVQRGGSYLCHVSYCDRYHVHSRTHNPPDTSTGNLGFRVASDC